MFKPLLAATLVAAATSFSLPARAESARYIGMSLLDLSGLAKCPAGKTVTNPSTTHSWIACSTEPPGFTNPSRFSWDLWGYIKWYSNTVAGNSGGICSIGQVSDQACVDATPSWCRCFRDMTVTWSCR